jgi:hypothetical protein
MIETQRLKIILFSTDNPSGENNDIIKYVFILSDINQS